MICRVWWPWGACGIDQLPEGDDGIGIADHGSGRVLIAGFCRDTKFLPPTFDTCYRCTGCQNGFVPTKSGEKGIPKGRAASLGIIGAVKIMIQQHETQKSRSHAGRQAAVAAVG